MKKIKLTQGQVALVDDWRYDELNQWKWFAQWNAATQSYYAHRQSKRFLGRQFVISMSSYIMKTPKGMRPDHINHDTLDNQEHNLRNVTHSQNQMNKKGSGILGEKGIRPHSGGYQVRVIVNGKSVFSRWFKHLPDAIAARDLAHQEFHGEYRYEQ